MTNRTKIAAAGNTLAPALAVLQSMGYDVKREPGNEVWYEATNNCCSLRAEDPLALLGLAKLYEVRGNGWQPSDEEVLAFLALEGCDEV